MTLDLTGILPVLPTPFEADGSVDVAAMPKLVRFAMDAGVAGVVFPGFASEVEHLTAEERKMLLKKVVESAAGQFPVIAGASAETAEAVIGHGEIAHAFGVTALMIQTPKSIGNTAKAVIAFLTAVTDKLPEAQIILQNAPAPRGSDLSGDTILEVANAISNVVYIKEETLPAGPSINQIMANKPAHLKGVIGGGGARYILDEYARGACAAMPAIEIADLHVEMDRAWRTGDSAKARDLYVRTLPLLTLQAVFRMRLTKHTMMRRGILKNADVRAPTAELDAFSTTDIDENLKQLGILVA